jgi:hypothetical protein
MSIQEHRLASRFGQEPQVPPPLAARAQLGEGPDVGVSGDLRQLPVALRVTPQQLRFGCAGHVAPEVRGVVTDGSVEDAG